MCIKKNFSFKIKVKNQPVKENLIFTITASLSRVTTAHSEANYFNVHNCI